VTPFSLRVRGAGRGRGSEAAWLALVAVLAFVPFVQGFTGHRIFYIRDLSLFFWSRFLWLRRTLLGGEWPWWDPYVGAGQAAYADALHQMFLLPVLLIRLIGSEVFAFNLWVALPFPLAAAGAWMFFARRFSAPAAALGASAYALAGPVVATSNFPNMSWSVALVPWVLWAVDRLAERPTPRRAGVLALTAAFQALAGEPVTLFSTFVVGGAFAVVVSPQEPDPPGARVRRLLWTGAGLTLGVLLAAVQVLPLASAAAAAERASTIGKDLWSLHPLALLETVCHQLFGDYYRTQSLLEVPWMPPLNSGREPFFFSIYFGVPLLSLALFGIAAGSARRWSTFWAATAGVALIGAFGTYTPIYPFVRDHLPVLGSFRFPVKYLVIVTMAVAAGAAAGWDALQRAATGTTTPRLRRARHASWGAALTVGAAAYIVAGLCLVAATPMAFRLFSIARALDAVDPVAAAEFMLGALPRMSTAVMLISVSAAGLIFLGSSGRREAALARPVLYALIVGDLLVRAWGICPAFDPRHVAEPEWLAITRADPDARFYVGGKRDGTLDAGDADSSRRFLNPPGLRGSASRAALSAQTVYYPSAWRGRELLSYDLAVLWPRVFTLTEERFFNSGPAARARFLERTGIRYRIVPARMVEGRKPIAAIPYYEESFLYDWGPTVAPRVGVVERATVIESVDAQIDAMFASGWDCRDTVLVQREPEASGAAGAAVSPFARIAGDRTTQITVEAGAGERGGYLVVLDSYSDEWQVSVDGRPAPLLRANGLFRAVRLAPGTHTVDFHYRPRALYRGAAISGAALLVVLGLLAMPFKRRPA
jgi:hypothetical protein